MKKLITESAIETFAIELFEKLGYQYVYAPDIAPDSETPERERFEDVLLLERLRSAMGRINPSIPADVREEAIKQVQRLNSPELIANNEAFHRLLTEGIKVVYQDRGNERGDLVWLVDFAQPENNEFVVANQFTVIENHQNKRLDVVLFVNGLPLVVVELKNAADENATIKSAYRQLQTYKEVIPSLFTYNGMLVISDGLEAKVGSLSAGFSRFMAWKTADGKLEASALISQLETLIQGMLNKATLLDLLRHFIVFERGTVQKQPSLDPSQREGGHYRGGMDLHFENSDLLDHPESALEEISKNLLPPLGKDGREGGVTTVTTIKKLAAYHQYYAVNAAVASTLRAASEASMMVAETPESYGLASVETQPPGDRKAGVVWHTQGSGKSLSMVFYTGKIVLALDNPTIVMITDRNDLDDQLFDTFAACTQLLRQEPVQVDDRKELKRLLRVASGGVIFTTIQKFQPEEGNIYEELTDRRNVVVIADEAHRTQYGFRAKTVDEKDAQGNVTGKRVVYGFAKYLRDALPNATYLGFTGTPIEKTDINTPAVFGNYVDVYDIAQAVEDGATKKIYYESRLAKVSLSDEGKKLISAFDETWPLQEGEESDALPSSAGGRDERFATSEMKAKAKWTQMEALVGAEQRIKSVAQDIVAHFEKRQEVFAGKGMIVAMSRRIAADLYEEIVKLKPEWHSDDLTKGVIKVVITAASSDGPKLAGHHTTKQQRKILAERMKNPDDEMKLVIVRDMWLTGFDAPCMHTLYIDKPMKGHNLMQAIARVNRVYGDKPAGLVVDYLGIASDLKQALSFYADAGGKGDPMLAQEQAVQLMLEKIEVVAGMYHGFPYEDYFEADTSRKLSMILAAEEHILGLENGKKRYIDGVTALSQAFAIAIPHEQAMDVKDEVAFFQAVKARLAKFDSPGTGRTNEEIESTIRQVIDKALVSEQVIDVFDAAGIKKPDISILSEEFLLELKNKEHKNVALEVLKKLLNDEIKARAKKNLVQSRTLMEMLQDAIKRYHAKVITAAEVMDELINISKEIVKSDKQAEEMGMSEYEYAFYTAVANNDSARELMQQDKLRELAVVLFERVKANASIDWTIKESVKAKLKVIVKRTLRQFGYPPDMQKLATETVLKQAEMLANELLRETDNG